MLWCFHFTLQKKLAIATRGEEPNKFYHKVKINTPDTIAPFLPALLHNANNINNLGRITSKYVTKGPRDEACIVNALSKFRQMKDDAILLVGGA